MRAASEYTQSGIMSTKAVPLEKKSRFILSSFPCELESELVGMIFLKKMFCDTKTKVEPNAQNNPKMFESEMSTEVASMTPAVSGNNDKYVGAEYDTPKRSAYAMTVKSGDKA